MRRCKLWQCLWVVTFPLPPQFKNYPCLPFWSCLSASPWPGVGVSGLKAVYVVSSSLYRLCWLRPAFKAGTGAICHQHDLPSSLTVQSAASGLITAGFMAQPGQMVGLVQCSSSLSPTGHTAADCCITNYYITIIEASETTLMMQFVMNLLDAIKLCISIQTNNILCYCCC